MNRAIVLAALSPLVGCFSMTSPGTTGPAAPPLPMNDAQALDYARAHRDTTIGIVHATNSFAVPICRLVFLSEHRTPLVNQAGPHERQRGNLDPSDAPLLAPGQNAIVTFPNEPGAMIVTAFGCDRTDKHMGMYVVDENRVLFQKTVAVRDQGRLDLVP